MPDSPGIGEEALNKAAEIGLSSQLDEVKNLDVHVKTEPLKLIQGEVDQVTIEGEGLVVQKDLRMEELDMQMDNVAINPLSVAFGKIELTKPTEATAHIVLTEEDINRAFNSEYIRTQLQKQKIPVDGQLMTIILQEVNFRLPGENKVSLKATVLLKETSKVRQVAFSAVPCVIANGQTVSLENIDYGKTENISQELTKSLINQIRKILNLSNFDLEGINLRVKHLKVEVSKLILQAEAHVEQIPSA